MALNRNLKVILKPLLSSMRMVALHTALELGPEVDS